MRRLLRLPILLVLLTGLAGVPPAARGLPPLQYTIRFPDPASKAFTVDVVVPTDKRPSVDLMMAIWSPGFYGLQNYAQRVSAFTAKAPDGTPLDVTKPSDSRWTVAAGGRPTFTASYTVAAPRGSNLGNGVTDTSAVIIGPATYITLVEPSGTHRVSDVTLEIPAGWTGTMTSLDPAPDKKPNHYVAPDYDTLADSPILAGTDLTTTPFDAGGIQHFWTYLGYAEWEAPRVIQMLDPLIQEHVRFWGRLPYKRYAFLNIVIGGGGGSGVEHLNSVAITTSGREPGHAGSAIAAGRIPQPRILPRHEREAFAAGRTRTVRLRARAGHDGTLGRRRPDVLLRRLARRQVRRGIARGLPRHGVETHHRSADEAARTPAPDARAVVGADV